MIYNVYNPPLNNLQLQNTLTESVFTNTIIAGDFGGHLHQWEIDVNLTRRQQMVRIRQYNHFQSHRSHIVSLQVSARRVVSGSRDKTVLVQDFWAPVASKRSI